jgi:hypothetical protein
MRAVPLEDAAWVCMNDARGRTCSLKAINGTTRPAPAVTAWCSRHFAKGLRPSVVATEPCGSAPHGLRDCGDWCLGVRFCHLRSRSCVHAGRTERHHGRIRGVGFYGERRRDSADRRSRRIRLQRIAHRRRCVGGDVLRQRAREDVSPDSAHSCRDEERQLVRQVADADRGARDGSCDGARAFDRSDPPSIMRATANVATTTPTAWDESNARASLATHNE